MMRLTEHAHSLCSKHVRLSPSIELGNLACPPQERGLSSLPLHLSVIHVKSSRVLFRLKSQFQLLGIVLILFQGWYTDIDAQELPIASSQQANFDDLLTLEQVSYDLFTSAQSGHIHQIGPTISPNAPGWEYMTRKGLGQWRKPTLSSSGRWVSHIEGRGGYIDFPITEEDQGLERLSIWLEPATSRQIVSVFLDEELISNMTLHRRPKLYRLKLSKALEAGEHRLRLWFRSSRVAPWGGRTAGAVGPIQFTPKKTPHTAPAQWTGNILVDQQRWGVLYAPPPTSWRFYLTPPTQARLDLGAWVGKGPATHFEVRVARDGEPEKILSQVDLKPSEHQILKVPLADYAQTPIRLTLRAVPFAHQTNDVPLKAPKSKGKMAQAQHMQVGWLSPKITGQHPSPKTLSSVKNIVLWAIDGLNQDVLTLIQTRAEELPTLSRFLTQSYQLPSLWSGTTEASSAHDVLLFPDQEQSLTKLLHQHGILSSLITLDAPLEPKFMSSFDHIYEVTQEGVAGHIEGIKHLAEYLSLDFKDTSKQARHLIYLTSSELKTNSKIKHGFRLPSLSKEYGERHILNQLALLDYQLMMIVSELSSLQLLDQSMLLLVGVPNPYAYVNKKSSLSAAERALRSLEVSALLWHPQHLAPNFTLHRGHLSALSSTIAQTLMLGEPSTLPYDSLSAHLLNQVQLPPQAQRSMLGPSTVTRLGDFVLYEVLNSSPSLKSTHQEKNQELSSTHPITLRVLKDALSSARLDEGL